MKMKIKIFCNFFNIHLWITNKWNRKCKRCNKEQTYSINQIYSGWDD